MDPTELKAPWASEARPVLVEPEASLVAKARLALLVLRVPTAPTVVMVLVAPLDPRARLARQGSWADWATLVFVETPVLAASWVLPAPGAALAHAVTLWTLSSMAAALLRWSSR